jgi:16S rRNA (uracil1498-N3)-methyltransferase
VKPLRVPVEVLEEGDQVLGQDASHYVLRVHRKRPGDSLLLFDPSRGLEGVATLTAVNGKTAVCRIERVFESTAVPRRDLVLIQALAKGDKVERVVRDATALGATSILIVRTARCVPGPDEGGSDQRRLRWQRIAVEAARQCGRGNIPLVVGPLAFDGIFEYIEGVSLRVVLSPDAVEPLSALLSRSSARALGVFIGPEGGLDDTELARLEASGFSRVRFGDFTLRTETAATAVLGALLNHA